MALFSLAASLLQSTVSLVIGVHLLRLGLRSRRILELSFGLGWLAGALSNVLWLASATVEAPAAAEMAYLAGRLFAALTAGLMVLVTWWTFRRRSPWATALTLVLLGGLAAGVPTWMDSVTAWFRALPYVWLTIEALLEQGRLRRQLRFGLERDRTLADQMLFLGMTTLSVAILYFTLSVWAVFFAAAAAFPMHEVAAILAIVSAACSWLAFLPPNLYLQWARGRESYG